MPMRVVSGKSKLARAGDHDHIRCFTDQVKLTRALVQVLDDAVMEV
jgi:hypothetical protein